ncbi:MAG: MotA/TolQ/ExbB proton channel family protein [Acidobacteriota bacterium]|jgi:biopolymer transport protein ExbB/biopolymer transport protein TolQ
MGFSIIDLWNSMGFLAKSVAMLLMLMSLISIWVFIDRFIVFRSAKKQSLEFIGKVGNLLKQNKLDECIDLAKKSKNSHLAKVFSAALLEFKANTSGGVQYNVIEAAKRAIERATVKTSSEMKRGLSSLATIGATAPFVGLFGTVIGIINAFRGMALTGSGGIGAVAGGISEALITTAFGLFVAIPAVWFYNYFVNKADLISIEMSNASSELVDHFIKVTGIEEK